MEAEPPLYRVAGAMGPSGEEAGAGGPDGVLPEGPELDEFVGAYPDYNEEEEERRYYRRKRLGVIKNVVAASLGAMLTYSVYLGLLEMQMILHYDETYREVKYGSMGLPDIDEKMLMGINVTPVVALLYTPVLIRFFGTKWVMFLAVGIYALFVSTNYWERFYTLVPSSVALGVAIVPLWASLGNYITRMSQKYYEYVNYKEEHVEEQRRPPRGAHTPYLVIFQTIFYSFFHLSFACAQGPMIFFLNGYLYEMNHTLYYVQNCGTNSHGILMGFNKTVLQSLPRSRNLIVVESVLMSMAFLAMVLILALCGSAYRPTEEIDLRSVGWGNIFQLPFKHMRDYRLRHLFLYFIYTGFEVLFLCTGFTLGYGVCAMGLERLAPLLVAYGLGGAVSSSLGLFQLCLPRQVPLVAGPTVHLLLVFALFFWAPKPCVLSHSWVFYGVAVLWSVGSALSKISISALLGILYEDKERQDFVFTIYHWWQALAIFAVYLGLNLPMKAKLAIMLVTILGALGSYLWMESKLKRRLGYRLPRIPRPQHKVCGYRYLEDDNSDESERESAHSPASSDSEEGDAEPPGAGAAGPAKRRFPYEQALDGEDGPGQE
ncbi:protein unc-93 homolog B1 [Monodelphis domestica]|uniref:Unc-93 homolog B1, TLR signaling regulator n=1 Tax=Monodelphis domestica TaxID=13616 RepID=H9H7X6_MONDO|nr:protein unc-93 homolog B1 [Monodelphis domestica]